MSKEPFEVVLLDCNNYHTFLPLLYQVAAAEIEPEEITYPVRSILRKMPNARFVMAEVRSVDFAARTINPGNHTIPYDYLILSVGSVSNFFGVAGAEEHAFPLKTMEQAIELRNHILCCFERAVQEPDVERRKELLTFVIVGGGPTGVEYAGALAELICHPLVKDYPKLDFREVKMLLLEAMDSLMPAFPERLQTYAANRLRGMGVDVRLGAVVSEITPESVLLKDGTSIRTRTVAWTAGVRGEPLAANWGLPTARNGRVKVLPTLQTPDYPEVYVIGDLAHFEQDGTPLPQVAPVAIQQGTAAALNVSRQVRGEAPLPFRYNDPGTMVTIGRNAGAAQIGSYAFTGFPAWLLWLGVHIYNLIGFRNRLFVLINWAWDYFFYERAVRLILP